VGFVSLVSRCFFVLCSVLRTYSDVLPSSEVEQFVVSPAFTRCAGHWTSLVGTQKKTLKHICMYFCAQQRGAQRYYQEPGYVFLRRWHACSCAVRCARLAGAHTCAACTPPPSDRIRGQKALTAQRRPGGVCLCLIDDPPAALAARAAECHCHAAAGSSWRRAWSWLATLSRLSSLDK
jgi:hypothetical protein